jgi:hypothetical protein
MGCVRAESIGRHIDTGMKGSVLKHFLASSAATGRRGPRKYKAR